MDDKWSEVAAVLAKVAHDLRTPLAVVHTTANMLLNPKYQFTPEQIRNQHERIRRNTDLMHHMIGELSDLVQLRSGTLALETRPVDVDEVLREVVAANEGAARQKNLSLACDTSAEPKTAVADRARLSQLFQTLVSQAISSSSAGAVVSVRSEVREGNLQVQISGGSLKAPVADMREVFEPWENGAGLGFFIGKGIVEAHDGQIQCSAQPPPGLETTFSVTLPLAHLAA